VPAAWVTGDEIYGDEIYGDEIYGDEIYGDDTDLRRWLAGEGHPYVLAVSASHAIWHDGTPERVDALVAALPAEAWVRWSAGAGSQGERLYDWVGVRLPFPPAAGQAQWLLARRRLSDPTERAYYRAYGPEETTLATLVQVAGQRWAIEVGFEDAKDLVGLDQYEVRKWTAWYRHITLALLAHAYLTVLRVHAQGQEQQGGGTKA
jgi:SRSO17 transposase